MKAHWQRFSNVWGKQYSLVADDASWLISIHNPGYVDGIAVPGWHWKVLVGAPWEGSSPLLWRAKAAAEEVLAREVGHGKKLGDARGWWR